jgi:hypothetical protein
MREAFTVHSPTCSDGQYKVNNFNPLSDIMRYFDPVWRFNLIAVNLKNIHRNKLIQIL